MKILNDDNLKLEEIKNNIKISKENMKEVKKEIVKLEKEVEQMKSNKKDLVLCGLAKLPTVTKISGSIIKTESKINELREMYSSMELQFKSSLELELSNLLNTNKRERVQECNKEMDELVLAAFKLNNEIWEKFDRADEISQEYKYFLQDVQRVIYDENINIKGETLKVITYPNIPDSFIKFCEFKEYTFKGLEPYRKYKKLD